eukprot:2245920-Pyramimonas_sp.AAC.1
MMRRSHTSPLVCNDFLRRELNRGTFFATKNPEMDGMSLHAYVSGKSDCADARAIVSENNQGAQRNQQHASSHT